MVVNICKNKEEKSEFGGEQAAKDRYWKIPICYDDDEAIPLQSHRNYADELLQIISSPEYDCFYFKSEPDPGELTSIVDSGIRENVLSTTNVNLPFEDDQSPLLAYVVWIFLPFLTIARIFEASRARGFVLRSQELQILNFIWEIQYPNLID
ncbi:hypothetical protein Tco_0419096 [Tanacetum coccineum]